MNTFNDIACYINFLKKSGLGISVSCFHDNFEPYTALLLEYEIHPHTVCNYLKSYPKTLGKCVSNKRKLEKKDVGEAYYSCCWAGVEEYVIPIKYNGKTLMCVNVSGYRGSLAVSEKRKSEVLKICDERYERFYGELDEEIPSLEHVMSFVKPLEYMVTELYKACAEVRRASCEPSAARGAYTSALRFINDNYMSGITAADVAAALNYSVSYLRYIFKKESGDTVSARINDIRLDSARILIENTSLSITDIALSSGFGDSNYFSTVFKKRFGASPSRYRAVKKAGR